MRIMVRHAESDFAAMKIADAMEAAGAQVFSITYDGTSQEPGAMIPQSRFLVWAKIESYDMCDAIDEAIDKKMGGQ